MIKEALDKLLEPKKKNWPCHINRISGMDDECVRRLYYKRTAWEEATQFDTGFCGILETGTLLGEENGLVKRILMKAGAASTPEFRIIGAQNQTVDNLLKQYQIQGSIDGLFQTKTGGEDCELWNTIAVADIKTCSPNIYPSLNNYDDLARYRWTRKYRGQLMLYALGNNLDNCVIILVNKNNLFEMKEIWFDLDYDYAEGLLKKADEVNKAIVNEEPPPKINDPDICPNCRFAHICLPNYEVTANLEVINNTELEGVLERLLELDEANEEIRQLVKVRDNLLVKGHNAAVGRFLITWKRIISKHKAAEAKDVEQWRKKITYTN